MFSVLFFVCVLCNATFALTIINDTTFQLHIIHLNDFHARFEETSRDSGTCKTYCIGGISRIYTAIHQQLKKFPNSIVLNAGDNFQGTIWYNFYKWNVTQYFMNKLPFDAYTFGNHEFDDNIAGVIPFIKALNAPTLAVNIDDSQEPSFQGLYNKSMVIVREGIRIGIIGVLLSTTDTLSSPGKLKFLDESETVNKEADRLVSDENVDTIIVLSHCGYNVEKEIARKATSKISVIVGAHSHSFLYTGDTTPNGKIPEGPYPTVIKNNDGHTVLVVQAAAYTEFLGDITIRYNSKGHVVSWSGEPIYMDDKIPQDETINSEVFEWRKGVTEVGNEVIGHTNVFLDHVTCRFRECNFGNLVSDAMVHAYLDTTENGTWAYANIAVTNPGGIRVSLPVGNITYNDLLVAMPFENTIDVAEIKGKHIKAFLEQSAYPFNNQRIKTDFNFLQTSGIHVKFNMSNPPGEKVQSVNVLCRKCLVPRYFPLNLEQDYRIIVNSFLANGGDGFNSISDNIFNRQIGRVDSELLKKYVNANYPIIQSIDGRIEFV